MNKFLLGLFLILASPCWAADNAVVVTPGVGVPMKSKDVGGGLQSMQPIPYDGTNNQVFDPCQFVTKTYAPISITSGTTTRIVAPTSAKRTYVCSFMITTGAADNVAVVEGTGGTCGTGTAGVIGGTTAANGFNFVANGGISMGNGSAAVFATAGTNVDLCLITSSAGPLAGVIGWVQAP